ncbi:MAG: alkaline phosphatase family protein [Thermodesulfobacteriota bacterium]|nr:alkaline phosphatase family protein [Thermodesulfobacteriota bacterium]
MSANSGRVIIIGMDGATFELILPWIQEGKLDSFRKIMNEGVYGSLDPAPNMRSAASWTSFYTGKNPGKHGVYEFYNFSPDTYSIKFINGSHCLEPSLWRLLSDQGFSSVVINVPMTYPAESIRGIVLAGLDAPGTQSNGFCHPHHCLKELEAKFGTYILEPGLTGFIIDNKLDTAVERLFEEIEQKRKVMFHLMENEEWDFLTIVYRSLDAAQHCFWKFMDPRHPQHDPDQKGKYKDVILEVYQKLDSILGEVMDFLDPKDILMVMSDHGFGPKHPANNQLNAWLASKGYLSYSSDATPLSVTSIARKGLRDAYQLLAGKLPRRHKEVFARIFPGIRDRVHTRLCYTGIDWTNTKAYSDTLFSNIRINLKGREGSGIVLPGEDYSTLIESIKRDLMNCCDLKSGDKIVEAVFHRDEIYEGPERESAPDLTIRWREDILISGIKLDRSFDADLLPTIRPFIPAEDARVISGDHRRFGIFLAKGANIKKGERIENANIMDLVPTVLSLMGSGVPRDMDGKVLTAMLETTIFQGESQKEMETRSVKKKREASTDYEETEEETIADRLRQLGYLE